MATRDEKLFDEVLSQALNVLRLSASKRAATLRRLDRMAADLVKKLQEEELSKANQRRIKRVLSESKRIIYEAYTGIQGELDFGPIAQVVGSRMATVLQVVLGVDVNPLPAPYLRSVASRVLIEGGPLDEYWNGQSEATTRRFAAAVRTGLTNSETNQQIISRIVGKSGQPGIMEVTKRNAATLVQTSVQAVANDARRNVFENNSDVIKGIKQVSTLDSHTSQVCIAYSGASWTLDKKPIDKSPPWNGGCPRHFNCRSLEVPITKTFKEMGLNIPEFEPTTRASSSGQIDAKTTFDDYLKRMGKGFQDEVLGVGKADMWRSGKITLRDLVDGSGAPMTLEELRRKFDEKP